VPWDLLEAPGHAYPPRLLEADTGARPSTSPDMLSSLVMTPSSGNVFADLGFDSEEAEHLRVRSDLMIAVRRIIEERSLTQAQAAELFGVTQPRISNLVRGKIDLFSIDTLVDMLARAGVQVEVVLSKGQHRGVA
jgi:predicted XRE-type DNA-binding protein